MSYFLKGILVGYTEKFSERDSSEYLEKEILYAVNSCVMIYESLQ